MGAGRRLNPVIAAGLPVVLVGGAMLTCIGVCVGFPCLSTGLRYGLWLDECPDTDLRLDVVASASDLVRGQEGWLRVSPEASWLQGPGRYATRVSQSFDQGARVAVQLLDDAGEPVDGLKVGKWGRSGGSLQAKLTLPAIPDGDYTLRIDVTTGFESATVDLPTPLYAPAVVHLMSDRPLYKPGQDVLLRSVVLRRTDLSPLDGRPGRWRVRSPSGEEMLVEKDRAGAWGVADTSFPLDPDADVGTWTATWETGGAQDQVTFEVRPFRLPRTSVEVTPSATWYTIGDELVVEGRATYTSGAPIANAPVSMRLSPTSGRWPPPLAWSEPFLGRTGPDGRFSLRVGEVPSDLIERAELAAQVDVTDQTGETAHGSGRVVLSKESLRVEAVTELGDGLVEGFNNRAYLRVSTPDGQVLRGVSIDVRRPYDPDDPGRQVQADADGVASLQIDPGAPVTVVDPAPPVRVRPWSQDPPMLADARILGDGGLDLAERRAFDTVNPAIARCGTYAPNGARVEVALQVDGSGGVRRVFSGEGVLAECVAAAARGVRLPAGAPRTIRAAWQVTDTHQPWLDVSVENAWGGAPVEPLLDEAALRARRCLPAGRGNNGATVWELQWAVAPGSKTVEVSVAVPPNTGLSPEVLACVRGSIGVPTLRDPVPGGALGTAVARLQIPTPPGVRPEQPTTRTAYELKVSATADGEELGTGRLVLPVGAIPPLRLRANPSLAKPGDEVVVELLRGPDFYGELPEELRLYEGTVELQKVKVVDKTATFRIPDEVEGFVHVEHSGARAVVFVQPAAPFSVALSTDQPKYRPGETAKLEVVTRSGGAPVAAAVGLVGVDATLGQLASLLGPDDFGRVTVRATANQPAFGAFDPRALTLGQIRGENAARAAVLRINGLPMDPAGDQAIGAAGAHRADTQEATVSGFYRVLERTTAKVRAWEAAAPASERMEPPKMVSLWNEALAEVEREGGGVRDGYGRRLTLDLVPSDLLEMVDPRALVSDGTRLPEDVVSWTRYVEMEVGR